VSESAYNEGYRAAYWDKPSKDNPYPRDDPRNSDWYRGWFDAKENQKIPPLKYG
jgi:ribosome modulation factor